jgi:prepilin signal peptidase PulO-like enzyme (type II secretory pathway)
MNAPAELTPSLLLAATAACAFCDARRGTIPNWITYPTFVILLAIGAWQQTFGTALAGAAAVGGALLLLHVATSGNGLGLGDVKLGACIGAGLGVGVGLAAIGAAFVAGAGVALILLALRRARRGDVLPFGPYLAFGTLLATIGTLKW